MRERELKKEWIDAARETKQRQRAQRQSELSEVRRNVRRGVLAFEWNWAEVGLVLSQTVHSAFFFFFLNFGLNRLIRPIQAQVSSIPGESARVEAASAWVGENHVGSMRHDAAGCGQTRGQQRPLRVASSRCVGCGCGTPGAASVLPRLLVSIPSFNKISSINCMISLSLSL